MTGSRGLKTKDHKDMAMSMGRHRSSELLLPAEPPLGVELEPGLYVLAKPKRKVYRYRSLNTSGRAKASAAESGSLCCMLRRLSA